MSIPCFCDKVSSFISLKALTKTGLDNSGDHSAPFGPAYILQNLSIVTHKQVPEVKARRRSFDALPVMHVQWEVLIIISIVTHSGDKDHWLWMIIIISHSRMAVMLFYHQQHHPTDQGHKTNLKFMHAIPYRLCVKVFKNISHFTCAPLCRAWVIFCPRRVVVNGREDYIWQEGYCCCSTGGDAPSVAALACDKTTI